MREIKVGDVVRIVAVKNQPYHFLSGKLGIYVKEARAGSPQYLVQFFDGSHNGRVINDLQPVRGWWVYWKNMEKVDESE